MGIGDLGVLFFLLLFCIQVQILKSQNQTCNLNDLRALKGFVKGLEDGVADWGNITNAPSSNCCDWVGVSCDLSRVTKLELVTKKLKGSLSESLAGLDQLKVLNLSRNILKGSLPSKMFHLQKLEVLDLSYNYFNHSIPAETHLPSLLVLDVSQNSIGDKVDAGICKKSTRISSINLSMNYFTGIIPTGFGNCTSLQQLSLNSNYLSGNLPEDLFGLQNLKRLQIQENRLSGSLSAQIGNLSNLVNLEISLNGFSGLLPDVFGSLLNLEHLCAHSNQFIGPIPASLSHSPSIQSLTLRNNSFNGSINLNCTAMINLTSLDLGSNKFLGPLPNSLSFCRGLRALNLARNFLNSSVPESFKNLQSLTFLSLSNTSLHNISATLSVLHECRNLTTLVLTLNFHSEGMPTDANLKFENLTALIIANCGLTGLIPQWLRSSSKLQLLDLSWNRFGGTIPDWFGGMGSLFYLDLSNNSLSGEIPINLAKMASLINRNISLEEPYPDIPFYLRRNSSARGLQYNQILSFPPSLDLSDNRLIGPILPEFGNLKKLHVLNLKSNNLSGTIPQELSGMKSLENLDLSHNNLSGVIPSSLANLSFLSKFSVAYNHLFGRVPSEGQFLTFPPSSFEGNKGLCVEHYNACHQDPPVLLIPPPPIKVGRNKGVIIGIAVGIGSGTVFLLALMFLIMTRTNGRTKDGPEKKDVDENDDVSASSSVVLFQNKENDKVLSIDDLLKSTNNFDQENIIGCGGFGLVYKAALPDGRKVAIKRLSGDCGQMDREFQAEVETLSMAQHENLVLLQGYCRCRNDRLLIYSFMENGSLDYWLHEKLDGACLLNWETRLHIAQGAARGLAYLHQSCDPHILHRDVKSSNILLDENFEAHLADFGLARLLLPYDTHVSTDLVGTLGYIPPEYGQASVATFKGDVYSFGVVLLELLTGKRPMDMCKPKGCRDLISWVLQMKKEKREAEVLDPFIYDKQNDKQMLFVLEIACLCLSVSPKVRPSTQQIVLWLDNIRVYG